MLPTINILYEIPGTHTTNYKMDSEDSKKVF